ncbi:HWE histidine kinase domain-containing protein [Paracraurococcus lichenis]|uniref:HWE histidine kinase domain-containing protein n=1 Tax=Paracraurococcus lichenis TaxID=3064888 RepID=UPI00351DA391
MLLTPAEDAKAFRAAVQARVTALARAHTLLAKEGWRAADLRTLLNAEVSPHAAVSGSVCLNGPAVEIAAAAVQPIAMLVHELATNAAKHGALSFPGGAVEVRWMVEPLASGGTLRLRWAEASGSPVHGIPARKGFGSRVIETTVRRQLGGTIGQRWEATGLVVEVSVPLARVLLDHHGRLGLDAAKFETAPYSRAVQRCGMLRRPRR